MQSIYFDEKQTNLINSWVTQANETSNEYLKFMSNWIAFNAICYNLYRTSAFKNQAYLNKGEKKLQSLKKLINEEGEILANSTSIKLKKDKIEIDIKADEDLFFAIKENFTENLIFSEFASKYSTKIAIDDSLFLELKNSLKKENGHYIIKMAKIEEYFKNLNNDLPVNNYIVLCENNTLKTLKDVLYQIRCNIFHGSKTLGDINDDRIVKCANPILNQIIQYLLNDLGIVVNCN